MGVEELSLRDLLFILFLPWLLVGFAIICLVYGVYAIIYEVVRGG